ncbi:hypothetical protein K490DRAFT_32395 [Saccharata proteae CBS 121410]|uniref:DUF676 domain-containing protein n=1 Tax=Saccharata proteae CBS 121410 TaxID=1314787 RepID=A0A9P4I1Z4_9PEZI|nr:hypothetical protein K490DRAFT_32395 [Saccharata proteae CBS 121410]
MNRTDQKRPVPPPLPPRSQAETADSPPSEPPPPYSEFADQTSHPLYALRSNDSRSGSTQSLVPRESDSQDGRRKLLLVYIHGFMGNETSFQSFPAHVHNLVTASLSETHVVHTKIYPRYRSRRAIEFASEDFSKWLAPHLHPDTDVILLGHSMGGLLSAEVVLLSPHSPATGHALRHRILGTINFDVPFLGMHPGVVASGLSSIFHPAEKSPDPKSQASPSPAAGSSQNDGYFASSADGGNGGSHTSTPGRIDTLFSPQPSDPNYNPAFPNDVHLPVRKGLSSALHFINKHSDGLIKASQQLVKSHLEFGGAMADYGGLKRRYTRIRALDMEDAEARKVATSGARTPPRVRFVNYYTASTGRPKPAKSPPPDSLDGQGTSRAVSMDTEMQDLRPAEQPSHQADTVELPSRSPSRLNPVEETQASEGAQDPRSGRPLEKVASGTESARSSQEMQLLLSHISALPPVPPSPSEPSPVDFSQYTDKDARKIAEKDHARAVKAYKQAVKDRNSALKDRSKLEEKIAKNTAKAEKKAQDEEKKRAHDVEKHAREEEKRAAKQKEKEEKMSGEELRLEKERQRVEAEGRRMEEAEKERLRKQREMLGLPSEEPKIEEVESRASLEVQSEKAGESEADEFHDAEESTAPSSAQQSHVPSISAGASTPSLTRSTTAEARFSDTASRTTSQTPSVKGKEKPKRDKKFCMLPSVDPRTGLLDPAWQRVFMEGVDEVGAHCGLFFVGPTYEMLVGEVAARIESWVLDDVSERAVRELGSQIL